VPQGLKRWFDARGFERVTEMAWWSQLTLAPTSRCISHRTALEPAHALGYERLALGWLPARVQRTPDLIWRFLFPGDTGYSADFKAIRSRLGPVDFLALPIGAYLPRDFMKSMHVNPADAVQLMLDLEARQAMGVHWGTFLLTQEAFDQPPKTWRRRLARTSCRRSGCGSCVMAKHGNCHSRAPAGRGAGPSRCALRVCQLRCREPASGWRCSCDAGADRGCLIAAEDAHNLI